ncbi:prephenate dehydrogenase/arogenate dehydrogenase family protein [Phreatobacter sp. HK31-P]
MDTIKLLPLRPRLGIFGFGAFGRFMAGHLRRHFDVLAYDPMAGPSIDGVRPASLAAVAGCPILVFAVPVAGLGEALEAARPHIRPGALVLDVGSVKVLPATLMRATLPDGVRIVATHPLFGPESGRDGIAGLKIAICPVRGGGERRVAAFLRRAFGLRAFVSSPEEHDREAAIAQGLTHLIARALTGLEPLPTRITTRSFDLLMEAVGMVRNDAPGVLQAIEQLNPYAAEIRRRFLDLAAAVPATHSRPAPAGPAPAAPASAGRAGGT